MGEKEGRKDGRERERERERERRERRERERREREREKEEKRKINKLVQYYHSTFNRDTETTVTRGSGSLVYPYPSTNKGTIKVRNTISSVIGANTRFLNKIILSVRNIYDMPSIFFL